MELETILTGTKWQIIEIISKTPRSSSELSKELDTSMANISQQIRLLETAGLIKKKKMGPRTPGKPRTVFSISDTFALITVISDGFAQKRLLKISQKQKDSLRSLLKE